MAFPDTVTLDLRLQDDVLSFDGTNNAVIAGTPSISGDFSVEAWVWLRKKETTEPTVQTAVVAGLGLSTDGFVMEAQRLFGEGEPWIFIRTQTAGQLPYWANGYWPTFYWADNFWPAESGAGVFRNAVASEPLTLRNWHHLAGTWNNTTGVLTFYVGGQQVAQETFTGETFVPPTTALAIGATNTPDFSMNGYVREVRLWNDVRTPTEIADNMDTQLTGGESGLLDHWKLDEGSGTTANDSAGTANDGTITGATWITAGSPFWTDVLGDVRKREGIRNRYGILGQDELDRVGGSGSMEFWMKNDAGNSGGLEGFYSPGHVNARTGFELGIEARLKVTEGATSYYKHRGRINLIDPEPGVKQVRRTKVQSLDWMAAAALHKCNLLGLGKNVRSDVYLGSIIDNVPMGPVKRSLALGQETFTFAGDDLRDERVTAFAGMSRVTLSEFGYCFVIGDTEQGGLLKWQDRHARVKDKTVQKTFVQADLVGMKAPRSERNIRNRVEAVVFPREVGTSPEVLYKLQTTIQLNPNETRTTKGKFTDPSNRDARISGDNMIKPLKGTDYEFSSAPGGGGDLNDDLTITATYGATTVEYTLKNSGGTTGHITILQARGDAIRIYDSVESTAEDATSQADHFKRIERLRLSYQDDPLVGQDFADNVLTRRKDPKTRLETFSIPGHRSQAMLDAGLLLEPGDRIDVTESVSGISEEFFINGCEMFLQPTPSGVAITWTYWVTPASTEAFWLLGTVGSSELGTTTKPGF